MQELTKEVCREDEVVREEVGSIAVGLVAGQDDGHRWCQLHGFSATDSCGRVLREETE